MFDSLFKKAPPKYEFGKLRANLRMAVTRLRLQHNKRTNTVRASRREIAELLAADKPEQARVRVEQALRDDKALGGLEALGLFAELLASRVQIIDESVRCPPELKEPLTSLLWAIPRMDGIPEFSTIRLQLALKYGRDFCDMAARNEELSVNDKLLDQLGVAVPDGVTCVDYLEGIAEEYGVAFDAAALRDSALRDTDTSAQMAVAAALRGETVEATAQFGPTVQSGGAPYRSRFVIPPLPDVPRDDLEARLLLLKRS